MMEEFWCFPNAIVGYWIGAPGEVVRLTVMKSHHESVDEQY